MNRTVFKTVLICIILLCGASNAISGSISGTLSYSGSKTGGIGVGVYTENNPCRSESSYVEKTIDDLGSYTISDLPDGTYYLIAAIFTCGDDCDLVQSDPWGIYGTCSSPTPVVISNSDNVSGINIELVDGTAQTPNPFADDDINYDVAVSGNSSGTMTFAKSAKSDELWFKGFSVTGDGGGRIAGIDAVLPFATHSPPLKYLTPEVGQTWDSSGTSNGYTVNSTAVVKSVSETVSVAAGTFYNCVKVEETLTYPQGYDQLTWPVKYERWFCPGVGPAKLIETESDNTASTGELTSYGNITAASDDYFPLGQDFTWTFTMDIGRSNTWVVTDVEEEGEFTGENTPDSKGVVPVYKLLLSD